MITTARCMWIGAVGLVAIGAASAGTFMSKVEQPAYAVLKSWGDVELREYPALIVAEVEAPGDRRQAINTGFRMIADYIFGNNASQRKVAMTAPVTQQSAGDLWKVRFVMPSGEDMETLPKPKNDAVKLIAQPGERFAAIRFSGLATDDAIDRNLGLLRERIGRQGLTIEGQPTLAFYNPPWTLPFLRRNEILVKVGGSRPG
jgi:hypothetical protein